jgi:dipeptide/tripeptide permease
MMRQCAGLATCTGAYTGPGLPHAPARRPHQPTRSWGNRRIAVLVGGILMAIGAVHALVQRQLRHGRGAECLRHQHHVGMASRCSSSATASSSPTSAPWWASCTPPATAASTGAFTIFYIGINLGALLASPLVCADLGRYAMGRHASDFKWGFLAAGIGMLLGTLTFQLLKQALCASSPPKPEAIGTLPGPKFGSAEPLGRRAGHCSGLASWYR